MDELAGKQFLRLGIQRVYVKQIRLESNRPATGKKSGNPVIRIDVSSRNHALEPELYEVSLQFKVTVRHEDDSKVRCDLEFSQAGVFSIQDMEGDQLKRVLAIDCPAVLFPYARELLDNLMLKGGYPPMTLAAIDFEALYSAALKKGRRKSISLVDSSDGSVTH